MHLVETVLQIWIVIFSWASDIWVQYFLTMLGSGSKPQVSVSHAIMKVNNRYA